MTTEFVLLLGLFVFLLLGAFMGDRGPQATFSRSAPHLAARVERDLVTGARFAPANRGGTFWLQPSGNPPE